VQAARDAGVDVLVVRPWVSDLAELGTNSMRHFDRAKMVERSRSSVLRVLEETSDHPALVAARSRRAGAATG
ncbi:MAG: hypothetical protein M3161_02400, partial [Actinomycetota bacterium]|nr:hypothetical protein [Actinomycetota bacterium]